MPIKEKSSFRKIEFEYTSPDGEVCDITIVEAGDRKYVQFSRTNGDVVTMDGPMLLDMADKYREIMLSHNKPAPSSLIRKRRNLQAPRLVDHRAKSEMPAVVSEPDEEEASKEERPVIISRKVDGVDYAKVQTGVDYESLDDVDETPDEWSVDKDPSDLANWQRDAISRSGMGRPRVRTRGSSGAGFKRIGASDLM